MSTKQCPSLRTAGRMEVAGPSPLVSKCECYFSLGLWRRQGWGSSGREGSVLPLSAGYRPPQVLRDKEGRIYLTSGKASGQRGKNVTVNGCDGGGWGAIPSSLARPDSCVRAGNHAVFCPSQ